MTEHILQVLNQSIGKDQLYQTLLECFVDSVHDVLDPYVKPVSLYTFSYNDGENKVGYKEGSEGEEVEDGIETTALDLTVICDLLGLPILWAGDTGTGKTFTTENYIKTTLDSGSYQSMRLSGNVFTNNIFQPFIENVKENGGFRTKIKTDVAHSTGAVFIDELNRGKSDQALAMLDGKVNASGEEEYIGVLIPEFDEQGNLIEGQRYKRAFVVGAINPKSVDRGVGELSPAVRDRMMEVRFPNTGSQQDQNDIHINTDQNHEKFIDSFVDKLCQKTGFHKESVREEVSKNWDEIRAYVTDPLKSEKQKVYTAHEYSDFIASSLTTNLEGLLETEKTLTKRLTRKLGDYNPQIEETPEIEKTEEYMKIDEIVQSLDREIVPRDRVYMNRLAKVYSKTKELKGVKSDTLTIEDMAYAATLMIRNKQDYDDRKDPTLVTNATLTEYTQIAESYSQAVGYNKPFDKEDQLQGIRRVGTLAALHGTIRTRKNKSKKLVEELVDNARILSEQDYTSELGKVLVAKSVNDLLTLAEFVEKYQGRVEHRLSSVKTSVEAHNELRDLCYGLMKSDYKMPSRYKQRLERVFG